MKEGDNNVEFRPVCKDTPEEFTDFLANLKDPTEPEKHNSAWTRLWTQIKIWANGCIRKVFGATEEDAEDLTSKVMSTVFAKIYEFEIQDKKHCALQFCGYINRFVINIWMKIKGSKFTKRKLKGSDKENAAEEGGIRREAAEEQYQRDVEVLDDKGDKSDPAAILYSTRKIQSGFYYLDLFAKQSAVKAWVLRKAAFLIITDPEFTLSRDVKRRLSVSRETLWRDCKEFAEFVRNQPGSKEEGLYD
ncbi:MAG TPA: hypothetical protein DCL44_11395 [Elusimicrobia bacterium]|nr:hypothetical protein [Elusimicrobiota bacterium]